MNSARALRYSGIGCLLLILAGGPFFQGLFFWTPLLGAIALLAVGHLLWLAGRNPANRWGGAPGLALLALLGCYLLQFAWAVYPRGNLDWVLRVFAAWAAYTMVRAEAGPGLRRWLCWALVLSAAGLSVAGFMQFTGFLPRDPEMVKALGLVNLSDRMFTPLQYPNAAAAYLLGALFAACGLALEAAKPPAPAPAPLPWRLGLLTGLMTLLSLAFFFTVSRGAVAVLPVGLAVLFLGLDREQRWPALMLLLVAWGPAALAVRSIGASAAIQAGVPAFRWMIGATAAGAVAGAALGRFLRLKVRLQAGLLAGGLAAVLLALALFRPAGGLLPHQAVRLLDMNFRTPNVVYRLTLATDALKMVADRPLGRGGWGWERSYRSYQQYLYVGRETHNHYLQTAVDAGVPGLAALAAALGLALWAAWRSRKGNPPGWALAAGAAVIAVHSAIDFDLSYGAIWLAFWSMLAAAADPAPAGAGAGATPASPATTAARAAWQAAVASAGTVALAAGLLLVGSRYADEARAFAGEGKPQQATLAARAALRFDPLASGPLLILGDVPSLQRAARLDPQWSETHWNLAIRLEIAQDREAALREAEWAIQSFPLATAYYTKAASLAGTLMVDALGKGDGAGARLRAARLIRLEAEFARRRAAETTGNGPRMGPPLAMEPLFQLRYGQALFLTGAPEAAKAYLTEASKVGLLGAEGEVWLYAIYEREGDREGMARLANQPWVRFRNVNPVYKAVTTWQPEAPATPQ